MTTPQRNLWNQRSGRLVITLPGGHTIRIRAVRTRRGVRLETLIDLEAPAGAKVGREKIREQTA